MKYDLDYVKNLYVLYEETDPDDEDSFYTVDYTIGEHFTDDDIIKALEKCDEDYELTDAITDLVIDDIIGELKSLYIRDNTNTVLLDTEA